MGLALVIILLAIVFGVVSLLLEAAVWAFVIAGIVFLVGLGAGIVGRRKTSDV